MKEIQQTPPDSEAKMEVKVELPKEDLKFPQNIKVKVEKLWARFLELYRTRKLLVIGSGVVIFLLLSAVVAYAFIQISANRRRLSLDDRLVGSGAGGNGDGVDEPSPDDIKDQENPINGKLYTKKEMEEIQKRYPLAIVVENHVSARPQSGVIQADIVYEMLAEGGITRFLPIYWGEQAEEVGPVRSARKYMVDILSEYDALFKHIGWASDTGNAETDAVSAIYNNNIKSFLWGGYHWRSTDRVAPHNAYTSTVKLWEQAAEKGWGGEGISVSAWKFKNDADLDNRPETSEINLTFASSEGSYGVRWVYDKDSNMYRRENGGSASIDKVTGLQYEAKDVIVQKIEKSFPSPRDDKNRIILDVYGEGGAVIFRDGKAVEATWKKNTRTDRTRFYDANGEEVDLNRGQVWVELVPIKANGDLEGKLEYN